MVVVEQSEPADQMGSNTMQVQLTVHSPSMIYPPDVCRATREQTEKKVWKAMLL